MKATIIITLLNVREFARAVVVGATVASTAVCARPPRPAARAPQLAPIVIVLSFDGLAERYLGREHLANFEKLIARGERADGLIPPFPSKTFPSHYTMATGLYPGHHGIVGSSFYDPVRREWFRNPASAGDGSWFGGEPIWVTAVRHGLRSATFYWPGSEAEIEGLRPTYYKAYDPKVADSTKVDQIAAWLRLPDGERPRLIMAYFPEVDVAGHDHGPSSPEVEAALQAADRTLGRMLDSLDARAGALAVYLLVVSDHGMVFVPRDRVMYVDDLVRMDSLIFRGERATASLWSTNPARVDTIYRTLHQLLPHARAYRPAELPARWHTFGNPRFGDLLLVAETSYVLLTHQAPLPIKPGEHGYDPANPAMRGIFIAAGPRFQPGTRIPEIENVVLHPLIAELLGIPSASPIDASRDELGELRLLPVYR